MARARLLMSEPFPPQATIVEPEIPLKALSAASL